MSKAENTQIVNDFSTVAALDMPGTGKLIVLAILQHKTYDVARLMKLTGEDRRTVQRYRLQWIERQDDTSDRSDTDGATVATDATPVSCDEGGSNVVPYKARAPLTENPSGLSSTSEKKDPPLTPQSPIQAKSWEDDVASQSHPTITVENGKAILHNGTRSEWLERFGGDEEDLELALIDAVGTIQPNSRQDPALQITRRLSIIVRDRREKDKRYAAAVAANRKADKPKAAFKPSRW
jgi:hypothetical protein